MRTLILIISIVILILSLYQIGQYLISAQDTKGLYRDMAGIYYEDVANSEAQEDKENPQSSDDVQSHSDNHGGNSRVDRLREINPDIIGWITIPDTKIGYPVVKGKDNDYYLNHNLLGNIDRHGAIFMDYRNDPLEDENIIIYGHHMKDGTMFKDLMRYKKRDFYEDNTSIYLDMGDKVTEYRIFSVYISRASNVDLALSFHDKEEYERYFTEVKGKSLHPSDVEFAENSQMLTLATCTYEEKDARFIVHALAVK